MKTNQFKGTSSLYFKHMTSPKHCKCGLSAHRNGVERGQKCLKMNESRLFWVGDGSVCA